ncbi:MAG: hypothetical protein WCJ70_00160 [bacterium]
MSLLTNLFKKKPVRDLFHGLYLHQNGFTHFVFEKTTNEILTIFDESHSYSKGFDEVLGDVDESLFEAENKLDQKLNKIIFFVPTHAIHPDNKEVQQPYRRAISEIVRNLELQALGYVELFDLLKSHLPRMLSVYIECDMDRVMLAVAEEGVLTKRLDTATDIDNISQDISKLQYPTAPLVVFAEDEGVANSLIEEVHGDRAVHRLTHTHLVLGAIKLLQVQLIGEIDEQIAADLVSEAVVVPPPDVSPDPVEPEPPPTATTPPDEYVTAPVSAPDGTPLSTPRPGDVVAGFTLHHPSHKSKKTHTSKVSVDMPARTEPPEEVHTYAMPTSTITPVTLDAPEPVKEVTQKKPNTTKSGPTILSSFARGTMALVCIALVAFVCAFAAYEYFIHKVTLEVTVPVRELRLSHSFKALPITRLIQENEVSAKVLTSGTRDIGERAKGKVAVLNFQTKTASLSAKTNIYLNSQAFQIDEDVVLEPAVLNVTKRTIDASTKLVAASATFIGPEGNIAKGKQLTVGDFDARDISVEVEVAFGGGTKTPVSAITADDIKLLRKKITDQAKLIQDSSTSAKLTDQYVVEELSTFDINDIEFSGSQGAVASQVSATAQAKSELFTLSREALNEPLSTETKRQDPQGALSDKSVTYTLTDLVLSSDKKTVDMNVSYLAQMYTKYTESAVKSMIQTPVKSSVIAQIKHLTLAPEVRVRDTSSIKLFDWYVPLLKKNIEVAIQPAQ